MASIPSIDMRLHDEDPETFAAALGEGLSQVGFVGLTNHSVDDALVQRAYGVFRDFFALAEDDKMRSHLPGQGGARGYTPFGVEHAKDAKAVDLKEFWQVGRSLPPEHPSSSQYLDNPWPSEVAPEFESVARELYRQLEATGLRVLHGVAEHLGLGRDWFDGRVDYGNSILRAIHYPPIPDGEAPEGMRAAAHEDINVITLLVGSGEPGLEIKNHAGEWIAVDTIPGTIVCNVGDMLQRLTNKQLSSMTHQVRNPPEPWCRQSRYSIPFFLHFNSDFLIEALPRCVEAAGTNHFPEPITADAYLKERLIEIGLLPGAPDDEAGD